MACFQGQGGKWGQKKEELSLQIQEAKSWALWWGRNRELKSEITEEKLLDFIIWIK